MGLVLPTDCLLRWKSSCDSRYPCFFPNGYLYQCLRRTHFELDFWEIWLGVNLCKCGCVCLCVFWNFLQHPPFNGTLKFKWTTASKKTGLISSCSIPKHLLHALDIKETWQNTSLDARFLVPWTCLVGMFFFQGLQWQLICELLEAGVWFWISTSWSRMDQQRCLPKANQFPMDLPMECLRRAGNSRAFEQGLECL